MADGRGEGGGGGAGVDFASVADSEHYSVHKDAKALHSGVKPMKANKIYLNL